jgi:hypothetical protein
MKDFLELRGPPPLVLGRTLFGPACTRWGADLAVGRCRAQQAARKRVQTCHPEQLRRVCIRVFKPIQILRRLLAPQNDSADGFFRSLSSPALRLERRPPTGETWIRDRRYNELRPPCWWSGVAQMHAFFAFVCGSSSVHRGSCLDLKIMVDVPMLRTAEEAEVRLPPRYLAC